MYAAILAVALMLVDVWAGFLLCHLYGSEWWSLPAWVSIVVVSAGVYSVALIKGLL